MKELSIHRLENYQGGVDIGDTITGGCAAIGLMGALKIVAISRTAAVVIGVGCAVNGIGNYYDWW